MIEVHHPGVLWVYLDENTIRKFRIVQDPYFVDMDDIQKASKVLPFPNLFENLIEKRTSGKFTSESFS